MYKTILVHVDATARCAVRVEAAARLAMAYQAHLVGTAPTGLSAFLFPLAAMDASVPPIALPVEEMHAEADLALDRFEQGARAVGIDTPERRRVDEEAGTTVCLQSRYADLVVIGQHGPGDAALFLSPQFQPYVLLHCARPVLVIPKTGASKEIGRRVSVAWNGSVEAARAVASAIPLLQRAEEVHLMIFRQDGEHDDHGELPGADMGLFLARHGIKVEVAFIEGRGDAGQSLLRMAADKGSDLIVMGAYGHSRLREFVLAGVTRTALHTSTIPLWMAH